MVFGLFKKKKKKAPSGGLLSASRSSSGLFLDDNDLSQSQATAMTLRHLEELNQRIAEMQRLTKESNLSLEERTLEIDEKMKKMMISMNMLEPDEASLPSDPGEVGSYQFKFGESVWKVDGYTGTEPFPDHNYFPGLSWKASGQAANQVISTIIPCFNEEGSDLSRSIRSLDQQVLPKGWRMEAVIVMDGVDSMSESMSVYLSKMFGVAVNSKDPDRDPFMMLPDAEIIIVSAADQANAEKRLPVCGRALGGYSLVLKKTNYRKANSQMWWLGAHAVSIESLFALATDCGTIFDTVTTWRLIQRLEQESDLHAVTGFQRIMTSRQQGDGSFEFCTNPMNFVLRMLQRFEFEVDHVSFKAVEDSLGAMPVIPGPCGLYRYSSLGSLKKGLLRQYFRLFQRHSQGLILGNVELVEDRIPGTLLSFPLKPDKQETEMPPEGWSRTGFCYDAMFYVEAEKPLSQLVKQRRRWLNGTFATYLWMVQEKIITRSNQNDSTKVMAFLLLLMHIIQGVVVRVSGPALLIVWMFRFGLFVPDLWEDPTNIFDPTVSVVDLELEPARVWCAVAFGGFYLLLYITFVLAHTPRAIPVEDDVAIVRFTEPNMFRSDKRSSYRAPIMYLSIVMNIVVVALFILNAFGIVYTLGWDGTPLVVKTLMVMCFVPFALGLFDGIIRCDYRSFFQMCFSAPIALPLMVWFTIWLPAYATTRASDLTWGNRDSAGFDESAKALRRAKRGQTVAIFLIASNTSLALFVIFMMRSHGQAFPMFVLSYTMILSVSFLFSFCNMLERLMGCLSGGNSRRMQPEEARAKVDETFEAFTFGDMSDYYLLKSGSSGSSSADKVKPVTTEDGGKTVPLDGKLVKEELLESQGIEMLSERSLDSTGPPKLIEARPDLSIV